MKKMLLKLKILLTNISRVIMSFLFINLNFSYINKVFGVSVSDMSTQMTCYDTSPMIQTENTLTLKNILIILVPVIIVVVAVVLIVKNKKSKSKEKKEESKEEKKDDKKD